MITSELQGQLLDVAFAFTENLDGWQQVRGHASFLVEIDSLFLAEWGACS